MNTKTKKLADELIEKLGTAGRTSDMVRVAMAEAELSGFTEANEKVAEIFKQKMNH